MKSILYPIDFSNSNNSLQYAIQFSQKTNCKLILLQAYYEPNFKKQNSVLNEFKTSVEINTIKLKLKDELLKNYSLLQIPYSKNKNEIIVKFKKNSIDLINQTITKKDIDLIIIEAPQASGLKSIFFESKTIKLITKVNIPILIIPPECKYSIIKKILYSTDLLHTKKELKKLNEINKLFQSKISVIYFDNGIEKTKQELTNIKIINGSNIPFHIISVNIRSHIITNLNEFIKQKKNIAVCLFHKPIKRIAKLFFGSNTEEFALHLKSPLLSINKKMFK